MRNEVTAYQSSSRGGTLYCRMNGKRVIIAGKAAFTHEPKSMCPDNAV